MRLSLLARAYSCSGVLRPNGEIAVPCPSLSLVYHPPPGTITEFSLSLALSVGVCRPLLPPPTFPPTIAHSPSDSVSLHLSTIFVLSLLRSIYPSPSVPPYLHHRIPQCPLSSVPLTQRRTARLNSYSFAVRVTFETCDKTARGLVGRGKNFSSRDAKEREETR